MKIWTEKQLLAAAIYALATVPGKIDLCGAWSNL